MKTHETSEGLRQALTIHHASYTPFPQDPIFPTAVTHQEQVRRDLAATVFPDIEDDQENGRLTLLEDIRTQQRRDVEEIRAVAILRAHVECAGRSVPPVAPARHQAGSIFAGPEGLLDLDPPRGPWPDGPAEQDAGRLGSDQAVGDRLDRRRICRPGGSRGPASLRPPGQTGSGPRSRRLAGRDRLAQGLSPGVLQREADGDGLVDEGDPDAPRPP
ncbi:hypothetical protein ACOZE3_33290 [Streptomyces cinereoruber]|uniref:hypothetical protein n=1 Tax=Streptomyces cinereoruber TaxID=67260 RepID=UPI003BF5B0B5